MGMSLPPTHDPQPDSPEPPVQPPVEIPEPPIADPPKSPGTPPPVTAVGILWGEAWLH